MALTTKELLLVKDNVKMAQNGVTFLKAVSSVASEPRLKTLCTQMVQDHERDIGLLLKHVTSGSVQ